MSDICDLEADSNLLCVWSASNELYFQPTKCHKLRISGKKTRLPNWNLSGKKKTLDFQSLKTSHGMNISPKLSQRQTNYWALLRDIVTQFVIKKTLTLIYTSLIRSHFRFASQVWTPQSVIKNLLLIERTQRRAKKFICNDRNMNYQTHLVHLNLLPLNRPFPSSCLSPLQNESRCEAFLMKISFHSYVK